MINTTFVECPDINNFCTDVEFNVTQASLFLAYNTQDFTMSSTLYFYPAIRIERLGQYTYTPYQSEVQVKLIGKNFINTAKDLECRIANVDSPSVYLYATYVFFED